MLVDGCSSCAPHSFKYTEFNTPWLIC